MSCESLFERVRADELRLGDVYVYTAFDGEVVDEQVKTLALVGDDVLINFVHTCTSTSRSNRVQRVKR